MISKQNIKLSDDFEDIVNDGILYLLANKRLFSVFNRIAFNDMLNNKHYNKEIVTLAQLGIINHYMDNTVELSRAGKQIRLRLMRHLIEE